MRCLKFLAFVTLLAPAVSIAASPIQNMIDVPVPIRIDGSRYSIEDVRAAIILGSQTGNWTAELVEEASVRARLNVKNKHFAVVEIPYSESAYSIIYVSSENLDYNANRQSIHRNYNKWVLQLSQKINATFRTLTTDAASPNSGQSAPAAFNEDIYEELLRLDDLRDRGILTDEEFEAEKRKLLQSD